MIHNKIKSVKSNIHRMNVDKSLTLMIINYAQGILIVGQHEEMLVVRQGGHVDRVDSHLRQVTEPCRGFRITR